MPFWRRTDKPRNDKPRNVGPARADDDDRVWLDRSDPISQALGGAMYGPDSIPQAFEPKGAPEIYEDEIDPAWFDEDTADDY